jgi:hypothetical protein
MIRLSRENMKNSDGFTLNIENPRPITIAINVIADTTVETFDPFAQRKGNIFSIVIQFHLYYFLVLKCHRKINLPSITFFSLYKIPFIIL